MAQRRTTASAWVLLPAVLSLVYAIAVVVASWRAPEKGFLAFTGRRVVHVAAGGVAETAGLRVGDTIEAIDGAPVTGTLDYASHLLDRAPGETVTLRVVRAGASRDIAIALAPSATPWAGIVGTLLCGALLVLGLIARIGRPDDPNARRFYRTSIGYTLAYAGGLSWSRLIVHPVLATVFFAALFAAPPVAFDLAVNFPKPGAGRRWARLAYAISALLLIVFAAAFVVAGSDATSDRGDRALPWLVGCVALQFVVVAINSLVAMALQLRTLRTLVGRERAQVRWVLFAQLLAFLPLLGAIPLAVVDIDVFLLFWYRPFAIAIALLWLAGYSVAVLRVRLADVDALIRTSLGYAAATGGAIVVYLAVVLGAGWLTGRLVGDAGPWPQLVAGLSAAALFGPIRGRVGTWIDQRFFRDRRHYVEALRRAAESLAVLREPAALAKQAVDQVLAAVRAERGALYLKDGERWTIAYAVGEVGIEPPDGGIAVPVGEHALLVLGERISGDLYSSQDRDLLGALAGQLAVALVNANAFGTIAELSRELAGLRDRLEDENRFLRQRVLAATDGLELVGESRAIRELRTLIERVAPSDASVLVRGESGTGKGLVVRMLHGASARADKPFLHVDCGAIAASVFESELFGHERGAFTGATRMRRGLVELADGGTLFLDEIGELPLELQPKLLRVLEERRFLRVGGSEEVSVDVRIAAATHRDLDAMIAAGSLREDLYFRLRVVELVVPPLRARRSDLAALCAAVLPRVARRCGRELLPLADDALARMAIYGWPGNVRELENVLERALVLAEGERITAADLDLPDRPVPALDDVVPDGPHDTVMDTIEKKRLTAALRAAGGNQSHAAKALGMPRTTFINKLRRHGLL